MLTKLISFSSSLPQGLMIPAVSRGSVDIIWKLGDFGISTAGSSERLSVTKDARGSGSYYAPEILLSDAETPSYTNKVDIWGLEDSREILQL